MSDRKQTPLVAMAELGLGDQPQSIINGVLVDGAGADVTLVDPFTEEELFSYADADAALSIMACDAAQSAQPGWAKGISAAQRGQVMQDISRVVVFNVRLPMASSACWRPMYSNKKLDRSWAIFVRRKHPVS